MTTAGGLDVLDVLVVGGGPAGSTCATHLVRRGLDVAVLDKAPFPRDKVCAGWITPAVVRTLGLDLDDYRRPPASRTLQPFTGFRVAGLDGRAHVIEFGRPISYGIRRCEFDDYLLRRSGARLMLGQALTSLRRDGSVWVANEAIRARAVVGAGGHFCPVARIVGGETRGEGIVAAQEIEVRLDDESAAAYPVRPDVPDLFFWRDLQGYGWCVRKGAYVNIGAGRLRPSSFPALVEDFKAFLRMRRLLPPAATSWKGHAYLLNRTARRRVADAGVVLIGDAAGLALAPSGEGILSAIESGVMAATAIADNWPRASADHLDGYATQVTLRFGRRDRTSSWLEWAARIAGPLVLASPSLARRVIIEDGFLHLRRPELPHGQRPQVHDVASWK